MDTPTLRILSLCSGAGGIELGVRLAIPTARTICYVENEASICAILVARMQDGSLHDAPIWTDLLTFDGKPWRGVVDIVTAGFPCQPWSVAGRKRGTADERWLWPEIARIVCEVEPGYVFLENVPGLLHAGGLGYVLGDLAEAGYDAEWDVFSAAEVGASHRRERVFVLAYRTGVQRAQRQDKILIRGQGRTRPEECGRALALSPLGELGSVREPFGEAVGDAQRKRWRHVWRDTQPPQTRNNEQSVNADTTVADSQDAGRGAGAGIGGIDEMAWNPSPQVAVARDFGQKFGGRRVIIFYETDDGRVGYASYGRTKELCDASRTAAEDIYKDMTYAFELSGPKADGDSTVMEAEP